MRAADEGLSPPPELRLAWWCGESRLPEAGGVLDQEFSLFHRMQILASVYRFVVKLRSLEGRQIHVLTKPERRLWRALIEMGIL